MEHVDVKFENKQHLLLAGTIYKPEHYDNAVILCHDLFQHKDALWYKECAKQLHKEFLTFAFDFTGHGKSEGETKKLTITQMIHDLDAAVSYLKEHYPVEKISFIGHGFGMVPFLIWSSSNKCDGFITVNGYGNLKQCVGFLFSELQLLELAENGVCSFSHDKQHLLSRDFLQEFDQYDLLTIASKNNTPKLFIHATTDEDVPYEQTLELHEHAAEPKHADFLQAGDHDVTDKTHFDMMMIIILKFLRRTLLGKDVSLV